MAQKMHMKNTRYTNPHGLADKANHSTASELAMLSSLAMRERFVREIVRTKTYNSTTYFSSKRFINKYPDIEMPDPCEGSSLPFESEFGVNFVKYPMTWHNSNRLLTVPGFVGVKTGITQTAGSCLSVMF